MENHHRLRELLQKKEWTPGEKEWLLHYLEQADDSALFLLQQQDFHERLAGNQQVDPAISERLLLAIHDQMATTPQPAPVKRFPVLLKRIGVAALIAGLLFTGAWLWLGRSSSPATDTSSTASVAHQPDVLPGGNKAVLTLANGSTIVLDDAQNGALARQENMAIRKQDGLLIYTDSLSNVKGQATLSLPGAPMVYNSIVTPRGGQYSIILSDGSKVWLNAASKMRYPVVFTGTSRRVEISGEAYFEIAHNAARPFIVTVRTDQGEASEVEVLGTHFNINAYDDEGVVKTTLLEGKVKMNAGGQQSEVGSQTSVILKPGQQATMATPSSSSTMPSAIKVKAVDVEQVVAWKNGFFEFDGNTIQSVMRQLSRWYDVDVVYEGPMPDANFVGSISRQEHVSKVLKMLELTNVIQFNIQENDAAHKAAKIIVMKK